MQFVITSKLNIQISVTKAYWKIIAEVKHPAIARYGKKIEKSLQDPDEIRRSKRDSDVFLYYKKLGRRHICVVARHEDKNGFIITAYITNKIKEGELVWKR